MEQYNEASKDKLKENQICPLKFNNLITFN